MRKHTKATAPGQPSIDAPFTAQEELDRDFEEQQITDGLDFAPSLAVAKERMKKHVKQQAMKKLVEYRDSDITLTNTDINAYKTILTNDWTNRIQGDLDALTTIYEVRDYQLTLPEPA